MPSAMSSPMLPVETTWTLSVSVVPSLRRMIEPLPYSFSMLATARSIALLLFLMSSIGEDSLRQSACALGRDDFPSYTAILFSFQLSEALLTRWSLADHSSGCPPEPRGSSLCAAPLCGALVLRPCAAPLCGPYA